MKMATLKRSGIKECAMYFVMNGLDVDSLDYSKTEEELVEDVSGIGVAMIAFACGVNEESAAKHVVKAYKIARARAAI